MGITVGSLRKPNHIILNVVHKLKGRNLIMLESAILKIIKKLRFPLYIYTSDLSITK